MKTLITILLFPFVTYAGNLELGLGLNLPNAISESAGVNYKLGYNYDLYNDILTSGVSISYEHYSRIAQTIDIKNNLTSVQSDAAKLGFYVNEEVLALARVQYELGLSYFKLSETNITPTGGNLHGVYGGVGVLLSNDRITTKISYELDYAKNPTSDFGVNTMLMQSFKIGVMFEL